MPYFIYRVLPLGLLQKVTQFDRFGEASAHAKALRAADAAGAPAKVRVVFADNELQAEDLLSQVREAAPGGDE